MTTLHNTYSTRLFFLRILNSLVVLFAFSGFLSGAEETRSISFVNDVVPVLTKAGCNIGVCHAKAGGGAKWFSTLHFGI